MAPAVRRVLVVSGIVLLFLMLVGATYQGVATALERRRFPYPGRLIDAGGYQLHLYCVGHGTPTVVLEAPAVTMSAVWAGVQGTVAKVTRVCSYDRAGVGWSETGDAPFSPAAVAPQLHAVLTNAAERGPYVMAGVELGAVFAKMYASLYAAETVTLVIVNFPAPAGGPTLRPSPTFLALSPWLARIGLLRVTRALSSDVRGLPEPAAGELRAFLNRPDHLTRASRELARLGDAIALSDAAPLRRDLPVVQVEVEGTNRIDLVGNPRNARDVTEAITGAVLRLRG